MPRAIAENVRLFHSRHDDTMSFDVTLSPSGKRFTVEDDESVLEAAIRQGVGLPYGCRSGRCGSCMSTLIEGEVGYPDSDPSALEMEAADKCLPCVAYALSDLTLEIREVESAADIEPRMLPCRVQQVDHLAHDVVRLMLKLPEDQRLQFQAGQYLDFVLADGSKRAFSIANAPEDDQLIELHIRHVDGGKFTDWVWSQMKDRAILRIEAPHGGFVLDQDSPRPWLFIGGGTGFAPLKSQIEHSFHKGTTRPMALYWGVRSRRDLYLPDLPQQWADEHPNFRHVPVLSEPDADWSGRSGFVHEAVLQDIPNLPDYDIYMAGPPIMVKSARDAFLAKGVPDAQLHYDAFEYAAAKGK
jgi:CDP-4-dehydro-6-deoxyglucose reductase